MEILRLFPQFLLFATVEIVLFLIFTGLVKKMDSDKWADLAAANGVAVWLAFWSYHQIWGIVLPIAIFCGPALIFCFVQPETPSHG